MIASKNKLAIRGQVIGGILGGIGLGGSLVVAALGHGWAGFGIAMTSLVSLVTIFVYGREEQKKERLEKAKIQEEIKRGQPIEKLEDANSSGGKQTGEQQAAKGSRPQPSPEVKSKPSRK
ncbi:MAG: hypothetical protein ACLP7Q_23080 [Isosphaeraceae bacterium]